MHPPFCASTRTLLWLISSCTCTWLHSKAVSCLCSKLSDFAMAVNVTVMPEQVALLLPASPEFEHTSDPPMTLPRQSSNNSTTTSSSPEFVSPRSWLLLCHLLSSPPKSAASESNVSGSENSKIYSQYTWGQLLHRKRKDISSSEAQTYLDVSFRQFLWPLVSSVATTCKKVPGRPISKSFHKFLCRLIWMCR